MTYFNQRLPSNAGAVIKSSITFVAVPDPRKYLYFNTGIEC